MANIHVSREYMEREEYDDVVDFLNKAFTSVIDVTTKGDRQYRFIVNAPGIPLNADINVWFSSNGFDNWTLGEVTPLNVKFRDMDTAWELINK